MPYCLGIDIGSRNTKLVLLDCETRKIAFGDYTDTGVNPIETIASLLKKALSEANISDKDIALTYATGYGRKLGKTDKIVSEITCHAAGVQYNHPEAKTIIDIGGQDAKIISIGENKHIRDFVMNDKCAAGTGRFLEMVALRLGILCSELDKIALSATRDLHLSSTCVVFAESEIIGLVSENVTPADIARAVHLSIADRIVAQLNQLDWQSPVIFTGGVAFNADLKNIISEMIGTEIFIPPNPELTGALGAAIDAVNDYEQN